MCIWIVFQHQPSSIRNDTKNAASIGGINTSSAITSQAYSQANSQPGLCASPDYNQRGQQQYYVENNVNVSEARIMGMNNIINSSTANNKIPDIVLPSKHSIS